jgi:hypothetical protein
MPEKNPEIKKIFEITDDALQGLIGFHIYVSAAVESAKEDDIRKHFPDDHMIITLDWMREYDKEELLQFMKKSFNPIFYRHMLVATVSHFDAAIEDFLDYLHKNGIDCDYKESNRGGYRSRLKWVFSRVKNCKFHYPDMSENVYDLCVVVEQARIVRNIIVHNRGLIDRNYRDEFIKIYEIFGDLELKPIFDHANEIFTEDYVTPKPIIVNAGDFFGSITRHIRLLHFLHNEIQRQYFDCPEEYNYREEKKKIEWHRVYLGI